MRFIYCSSVATYVLPRHNECHSGSGVAYYRYIELIEVKRMKPEKTGLLFLNGCFGKTDNFLLGFF